MKSKQTKKAIRDLQRQCEKLADLPCLPPDLRLLVKEDSVVFCEGDEQWRNANKALRVRCPQVLHGASLVAALDGGGRDDILMAMNIMRTPILSQADAKRATEAIGVFFVRAMMAQNFFAELLSSRGPDDPIH